MNDNRIIRILMDRDGLTKAEAVGLVWEVKEMIDDCIANGEYEEAEEIFESELGLELDYLPDILI